MSMKKLVLILLAIMFICFGTGAFLMSNSNIKIKIDGKDYNVDEKNSKNYNVNEEQTLDINEINSINITSSSYDVKFIPEDRKDIKVHLYGKVSSILKIDLPKLDINKSGNSLDVGVTKHSGFHFGSMNIKLDIHIPSSYKNNITAKTASGNITINNLSLADLTLNATSGEINIENLSCNAFTSHCSSGNISSKKLTTKTSEIKCTSGEINFSDFVGDLKGKCTSGDVYINYSKFNNNVDFSATSGEITLDVPDNSEFSLDASSTSGEVKCNLPIKITGTNKDNSIQGIVKSDKNKINLSLLSGEIVVK